MSIFGNILQMISAKKMSCFMKAKMGIFGKDCREIAKNWQIIDKNSKINTTFKTKNKAVPF